MMHMALTHLGSSDVQVRWLGINQNLQKVCKLVLVITKSSHLTLFSGPVVKNPPVMQEMQVWSLGLEDPLEEGLATHSSILAWRIPWTEELGRLQSLE